MTYTPLRVVYMGTPAFAVPALDALFNDSMIDLVGVYAQPPRPAGRGYKLTLSPVHHRAHELGVPVFHPESLKQAATQEDLRALNPDLIVVAAYGLLLPRAVLEIPRHGCFNIHGSLLPRWRGAAPIQRAILAGDSETGITIMKMDVGLDTGDMILKGSTPIDGKTSQHLYEELSQMGARLIIEATHQLIQNTLTYTPQPTHGVTYAQKMTKEEGCIDWRLPASIIERHIRAFTPWPGSWFIWEGQTIKVLEAKIVTVSKEARPGTVVDKNLTIACGDQGLELKRVQRAGKPAMDALDFQRGAAIPEGSVLC